VFASCGLWNVEVIEVFEAYPAFVWGEFWKICTDYDALVV